MKQVPQVRLRSHAAWGGRVRAITAAPPKLWSASCDLDDPAWPEALTCLQRWGEGTKDLTGQERNHTWRLGRFERDLVAPERAGWDPEPQPWRLYSRLTFISRTKSSPSVRGHHRRSGSVPVPDLEGPRADTGTPLQQPAEQTAEAGLEPQRSELLATSGGGTLSQHQ